MQAWHKKFSSSCVQLPGDGANWTKTVFHCWLTGSCESIYSLAAMRQNGSWKTGATSSLRKCDHVHPVLSNLTVHTAYIISLCVCCMWLCRTMSDRRPRTHRCNMEQFLWTDEVSPFQPASEMQLCVKLLRNFFHSCLFLLRDIKPYNWYLLCIYLFTILFIFRDIQCHFYFFNTHFNYSHQ